MHFGDFQSEIVSALGSYYSVTEHHLQTEDWLQTPEGDPRGYINPHVLRELWFHTGTICNLRCPFCLEGSNPGNNRLQPILPNIA